MLTCPDVAHNNQHRTARLRHPAPPNRVKYRGVVAVPREILGLEQQKRPKLVESSGCDKQQCSEEPTHLVYHIGHRNDC